MLTCLYLKCLLISLISCYSANKDSIALNTPLELFAIKDIFLN